MQTLPSQNGAYYGHFIWFVVVEFVVVDVLVVPLTVAFAAVFVLTLTFVLGPTTTFVLVLVLTLVFPLVLELVCEAYFPFHTHKYLFKSKT